MPNKVSVLVMAAGSGRRTELKQNKVFYRFRGKTVLDSLLESLNAVKEIARIILVLNRKDFQAGEKLIRRFKNVHGIVQGGKERKDSVYNGLSMLEQDASTSEIILIHDGARPFLDKKTVHALISSVGPKQGAAPALPVSDTLKMVKKNRILQTIDRQDLFSIQTPQAFRLEDILKAYRTGSPGQETDDAVLFEQWGGRMKIIPGSLFLHKITWPEDLEFYRMMVDSR